MMGCAGTDSLPSANDIVSPFRGTLESLYSGIACQLMNEA
jgi:hypothetical protein